MSEKQGMEGGDGETDPFSTIFKTFIVKEHPGCHRQLSAS